jgi:hypothetical protein
LSLSIVRLVTCVAADGKELQLPLLSRLHIGGILVLRVANESAFL